MLDKKFFYTYKKRLKKSSNLFLDHYLYNLTFVIGVIKYYYIEWIIKN